MRVLASVLSLLALAWTPLPKSFSPEIPLAPPTYGNTEYAYESDVASDGRGFFVVSTEYVAWSPAMLFDEQGEPLLDSSVDVRQGAYGGQHTAVATSGRNYLVVWHDYSAIRALRFTIEGVRIDREPLVIRSGVKASTILPPPGADVDVAWDGTHYIVVAELGPNHYAATRVGEDGRVVERDIPAYGKRVAARNGVSLFANTAVAAGDDGFYVFNGATGRHYDAAGQPAGGEDQIGPLGSRDPAVVWNGTHWLVAFIDGNALYIRRLGIDAAPVKIPDFAHDPALASNGTRAMLTWSGPFYGSVVNPGGPQSQGVPPSGAPLNKVMIDARSIGEIKPAHRNAAWPESPVMTAAGGNTLVAWTERTTDYARNVLRVQPVHNGVLLPARTTELETFASVIDFATNGDEALLVLSHGSVEGLRFLRIAPDGSTISEERLPWNAPYDTGRAVWTGTHYLVVWRQLVPNDRVEYRSVLLDRNGTRTGSLMVLGSASAFDAMTPEVAVANYGRALVVWPVRLKVEGAFVGPGPAHAPMESLTFSEETRDIDVASDGTDFLLARAYDSRIAWHIISRKGAAHPGEASIATASRNTLLPELRTFWTGENYLIVSARDFIPSRRDLYAIRVATDGTTADSTAVLLATMDLFGENPAQWRRPAMRLGANVKLEFAYLDTRDAFSPSPSILFRWLAPAKRRGGR